MKLHEKILIVLAVIVAVFCIVAPKLFAGDAGWGQSWDKVYWPISYWNQGAECDSGKAYLGYPSSSNYYDTVDLAPYTYDSTILYYDSLYLDSTGVHRTMIVFYERGVATPDTVYGAWNNAVAWDRPAPPANGTANICRVFGYLVDLGAEWVEHATVEATLGKKGIIDTCANTLVFDRTVAGPTSGVGGYFYIDLIYSSCIGGEKYKLTVSKYGVGEESVNIEVPDQDTLRVTW